jgi:benzoyl-CoA reductase/2-hydroxyglutaryl-CoA dehydratase subunit BcrC/BadD/HgdB
MPRPYTTKNFHDAITVVEEAAKMYRTVAKLMADPDELRKLADVSHTIFAKSAIGAANYSAELLDQLATDLEEED